MDITVNDESRDVPEGTTVASLLGVLELTGQRVAVLVDGDIVRKAEHAGTVLAAGAQVEVVQMVGGG